MNVIEFKDMIEAKVPFEEFSPCCLLCFAFGQMFISLPKLPKKNILSIKNLEKLTRFLIQFSLTLYTPPAPRQKGEGRLGLDVHKVEESQSSVCQDENTVKKMKIR